MQFKLCNVAPLLISLFLCIACANDRDEFAQSYATKKGSYQVRTRHLDSDGEPVFTNRLILQDSLYLLQHAHNPVDWWAWGDAAFDAARKLDKPVLLSIGYSTCHWCHVMERESFENLQIAEFINQNFIPIKVDREQQPDIDEVYLSAVQMLSGKAGWPLTAVLTADALPFFGGTYFPPDQFLSLLKQISDTWGQRRAAIMEQAQRLKVSLEKINQSADASKTINDAVFVAAQQRILRSLSDQALGKGPAFPREPEMLFLLHQSLAQLDEHLLTVTQQRLAAIAAGGIHDQLGGGFHRYSVDAVWHTPHFEKMLYNQAQLGQLYALAYMQSGQAAMRTIAESTFDFLLHTMQATEGGFYAAIDAESEEREGAYYVWSFDELRSLLSDSELTQAQSIFGFTEQGNFDSTNVLLGGEQRSSFNLNKPGHPYSSIKQTLLTARKNRPHPATDKKIITAWNGMSISALLSGYQATGQMAYREAATRAAQRIWKQAYSKQDGLARSLPATGARIPGVLEDYAYLARALLDLYDLDNDSQWLIRAEDLVEQMILRFSNDDNGGFLTSSTKHKTRLIVALVTARDDAISSGNSIAAQTLARLYRRTGKLEYRNAARNVLAAFSKQLLTSPETLSGMLIAASLLNQGETGQTQYAARGKVRITSIYSNGQLLVKADIAAGWHINSYRVLEGDLIPTVLSSPTSPCATISDVSYPQDKRVSLGFQDDELLVYENQLVINAQINPLTGQVCAVLAAELQIQACSNQVCLEPEKLQIRAPLGPTTPPKRINVQ